jgi:protein involved in polysaccharide export with SLBB domain
VADPGTYQLTEPIDLVSALMLAGGPMDNSNLKKIHIVHNEISGQVSNLEINLNLYLKDGDTTQNPPIYPGDTIRVEHRRPGFFMVAYPIILGTITTAAAIALTINRIDL